MRFLMAAMQYPTAPGHSYLTTELADALISAGHEVEVLHLDWAARPNSMVEEFRSASGVRVVRCGPRYFGGLGSWLQSASKFVLSGRQCAKIAARHFELSNFEAFIAWMPASAIGPLVKSVVSAKIPNRLLFIWDFFPDHHHEIGRIRGRLPLRIARAWEQGLLHHFTAIICTLDENASYLRRRFRISPSQRVLVTPVWGEVKQPKLADRAAIRRRHLLPQKVPIAVFGGQIVEGRGFEQMLGAASAALAAGSNLHFLFVGDGRLAPMIRDCSHTQANVLYRPAISRSEYLELLGACDVGMVATVPGVSSFSIPSKTIDYLRAGLPIVAAVEHGNNYIQILKHYDVGTGVPFGQDQLFFEELERVAQRRSIREDARRCLEEVFDVRHALATLLEAVDATEGILSLRSEEPSLQMPKHRQSAAPAPHLS